MSFPPITLKEGCDIPDNGEVFCISTESGTMCSDNFGGGGFNGMPYDEETFLPRRNRNSRWGQKCYTVTQDGHDDATAYLIAYGKKRANQTLTEVMQFGMIQHQTREMTEMNSQLRKTFENGWSIHPNNDESNSMYNMYNAMAQYKNQFDEPVAVPVGGGGDDYGRPSDYTHPTPFPTPLPEKNTGSAQKISDQKAEKRSERDPKA